MKKNNNKKRTTYKYRGWIILTTFEADPQKTKPYYRSLEFKDPNPWKARARAITWYEKKISEINQKGKYVLPFASPKEFKLGKNAAYYVGVSFVICDHFEVQHDLLGCNDQTRWKTQELEAINLRKFNRFESLPVKDTGGVDIMKCLSQMKRRIDKGKPYDDIQKKMRESPLFRKYDDMLKNGSTITFQ
jgi:hypothetical protein